MKKIYILLIISLAAVQAVDAQFTKVGGGLGFTTGFNFHEQTFESNQSTKFDIFAKGIYEISLPLHVSPTFTWFIPHVYKIDIDGSTEKSVVSAMMLDINGHYVFNSLDRFELYGLAGVDIMLAKRKSVYEFSGTKSKDVENDNAIGLNLGLGTYIKVTNQFDLFAEAKYLISKYDQFMFNVGILLNLQWLSENENPAF